MPVRALQLILYYRRPLLRREREGLQGATLHPKRVGRRLQSGEQDQDHEVLRHRGGELHECGIRGCPQEAEA